MNTKVTAIRPGASARPSPFQLDPDYSLPALTSRRGVLKALRDVAEAAARGVLDPKTCTAVAYALQIAMTAHTRKADADTSKP